MTSQLQAIRGMHDVLPEQAPLWEFFEDSVRDWLRAYGYRGMRMPIVEPTALFVRSIGEATDIVEKEMYSFVDSLNGENLTLRPEGTASCVRAAIEHNLLHNGPQRLYYGGPMFRHERPAKGRYRQFHQIGVEALGYPGPDVDAEHLIMCARLWRSLGISAVHLEINSLGSAHARQNYRAKLVEYFRAREEQLDADSKRRLSTNPLRILDSKNPALQPLIGAAPRLTDYLDEAALEHFNQLQQSLARAQIPYTVNPRLVRGLDYYNFTVSEWVSDHLGTQGTVCAGGRYDGLFEQLGGKPAPACGFAMGVERLLALMEAQQLQAPAAAPHAYLVHQGTSASERAPLVAESLRERGLRIALHCGGGSFKSQMKKADASGARYAVIIGDDEVAKNQLSVKPLREEREQRLVSLEQAIELMR